MLRKKKKRGGGTKKKEAEGEGRKRPRIVYKAWNIAIWFSAEEAYQSHSRAPVY